MHNLNPFPDTATAFEAIASLWLIALMLKEPIELLRLFMPGGPPITC